MSEIQRRPYARKPEREKRIPVTISLSGELLKEFLQTWGVSFERISGHQPTEQEIKHAASALALQALHAACKRYERLNTEEAMKKVIADLEQ